MSGLLVLGAVPVAGKKKFSVCGSVSQTLLQPAGNLPGGVRDRPVLHPKSHAGLLPKACKKNAANCSVYANGLL